MSAPDTEDAPGAPGPVGADAAPETWPARGAEVERRVREELIAQLFAATPVPVWAGVPFAMLVAAVVWTHAGAAVVLPWLAIKLALALVRATDSARFARVDLRHPGLLRRWTCRYLVLVMLDTLTWGAMVPLFAPHAPGLVEQVLLVGGVLGVAAVGVFTTYFHLPTTFAFFACVMTPMIVFFLGRDSLAATAIGLGTAIYAGVLGFEAWRSHGRLRELQRLRFGQAALAEERARAAREAQAATEAKSRFLAAVSHEMRTPLNGVLGMAQLMRQDLGPSAPPALAGELDVLLRSARELERVIGDLLDLSAIEHGRLSIVRECLALRPLLVELGAWHEASAAAKGLRLALELDPALPEFSLGDASRLRQILNNLLGNAVKYTARGEVRLVAKLAAPGLLRFEVHDTGPGIDADERQRLFQDFERGRAGAGVPGTGLGLSISRRIARALGGTLRLAPAGAVGSCFVLELPQVAPPAAAPLAGEAAAASPASLRGARVLVVDDNEVNLLVACRLLERMGAEVGVAADGEQALARLDEGGWNAVLMDGQMPRLDGFEATRRWRQIEQGQGRARLPIVGLTAYADERGRDRCLDAGMDEHLAKPYGFDTLAALLARLLAAPGRAELRPSDAPLPRD